MGDFGRDISILTRQNSARRARTAIRPDVGDQLY
jgi:hypothetical protein